MAPESISFSHAPVLFLETMERLAPRPGGIYIDGTVGGAGHSRGICERMQGEGLLIGLDRDPDAVAAATARLAGYPAKVIHCNYSEMREALDSLGMPGACVDGVLLDLGVSSHQLDTAARGFSHHQDAPLDMRMSQEGLSARDIVNDWAEQDIARILRDYGEEKFAGRIAAAIARTRETSPIETTTQLADIVREAVPAKYRRDKDPAKKTFQAVRICCNQEFEHLRRGLEAAFDCLKPGGRLAVITFHSLEDRIVKQQFAAWCSGCTCPPDFPQCVCGKKPRGRLLDRKPVTASEAELAENRRSRSAKLRTIEKLADGVAYPR